MVDLVGLGIKRIADHYEKLRGIRPSVDCSTPFRKLVVKSTIRVTPVKLKKVVEVALPLENIPREEKLLQLQSLRKGKSLSKNSSSSCTMYVCRLSGN